MIYNKSLIAFVLFYDVPGGGECGDPPPDDSDVPRLDVKRVTELCQVCQYSNFVLNHRRNEGARLGPVSHNIIT